MMSLEEEISHLHKENSHVMIIIITFLFLNITILIIISIDSMMIGVLRLIHSCIG